VPSSPHFRSIAPIKDIFSGRKVEPCLVCELNFEEGGEKVFGGGEGGVLARDLFLW
jgi:hypothetical protein